MRKPLGLVFALLFVGCGESEFQTASEEVAAPDGTIGSELHEALGDDGELWVAVQDTDQFAVISRYGSKRYYALPASFRPHSVDFGPKGAFAYFAGVGNGDVAVVDAKRRSVVAMLDLGTASTHQAKPSLDGRTVFVAQMATKTLIRLAADEEDRTWEVNGSLVMDPLVPVCTVFHPDKKRAYVSTNPSGIAVVDIASLTVISQLPTAGAVQCGMVFGRDGVTLYADSNGDTGHFYKIDTRTDTITEVPAALDAIDLHAFAMTSYDTKAYIAARGNDALRILDLRTNAVTSLALDPTPGVADKPDMAASGYYGNTFFTLRAAGKVAWVNRYNRVSYLDIAAPSANAIHGIAVRF